MANQNFKVKNGLEVGTGVTISEGNIIISGIITATNFKGPAGGNAIFVGDGSGLTGVTASGTGVVVQEEGSSVGTAATINFIGSNVTATLSGGIANVTVGAGGLINVVEDTSPQLGGNLDLNGKNITGIGSISITGGISATGVSTFSENVVFESTASFGDSDKINVGAGNDLQIYHNGTNSYIDNVTGSLYIRGAGGNHVRIQSPSGEESIVAAANGSVDLYYDNSKKLETTNTGIEVTGNIQTQQLNVSGAGAGTTSLFVSGDARITGILTVGSSSLTLDGTNNVVNVGTALTLGHTQGIQFHTQNLHSQGFEVNNINVTGIVTATTFIGEVNSDAFDTNPDGVVVTGVTTSSGGFVGNLSGTASGLSGTPNITVGVITANSITGDGSGLTSLTGASAGTYGASANTPIITVDSNGRITGIATVVTAGSGSGSFNNVVEDTTPQLGGNLDLNSKFITGTGNIDITGYAAVSGVSTFNGAVGFTTHIHDAGTGGLDIRTNLLRIKNDADSETLATFAEDGAVSLYHDNALRLATTNTGVNITDTLNVAGVSTFQSHVHLGDSDELRFGAASGGDLQIYHDGSNSYIKDSGTGNLLIQADPLVAIQNTSGETIAKFEADGASTLNFDGSGKLVTTNTGVTVTGALTATTIVKSGGSSSQYLMADGSVSTTVGISTASTNVQATWLVTANGSSAYRFNGPGNDAADDNPDLYLVRGQRYRFTNNSGGSHPFQIRVSNGGSAYNTGVTNNGGTSGNIDFNVQWDAPAKLFYQCTSHGAMVGNIYIVGGPQVIAGIVTATGFSGSGTSLTGVNATTLDSIDSGSFLRSDADDTYAGNLTFNGFIAPTGTNVARNLRLRGGTTASTDVGISLYNGSNQWTCQLYGHYHASTPSYGFLASNWGGWDLRKYVNGELQVRVGGSDYTVWHNGNDGSGTGLDADTLDGVQATGFLSSTANDVMNAKLTLTPSGFVSGVTNHAALNISSSGSSETRAIDIDGGWSDGENKSISFTHGTATTNFMGQINCNYVSATGAGEIRFGKLYFGADSSAYVLDLKATSTSTADLMLSGRMVVGGNRNYSDNPYNSVSSTRLFFGSADSNAQASYYLGTNLQNYGGSYTKLDLAWHTGVRIGGHANYGGTRIFSDQSFATVILSVGAGNANVAVTNSLTAGGNITAYSSDRRLKENFKNIESPLEKISKLNGCNFDWIENIEELGFTPEFAKNDVGLIAQEVEAVCPQAVAPAPFDQEYDANAEDPKDRVYKSKSGEDYLTVKYEKIVPLLVEAIKEQQKQIDELRAKLENN